MLEDQPKGEVAYFGHDRTDSKVISRIEQFQRLKYKVFGLTYRRRKFNRDHAPSWENVDLGQTADYAYLDRLKSLLSGAVRIYRERRRLAKVDMVFARNIDMALLAIFGRLVIGRRIPIAYEVLDVHRFFLGDKAHHRFFRFLERWVLRQCDALIVSSEGYIDNYFGPVQQFRGRWFLLENKVPLGAIQPHDQAPKRRPTKLGKPWVIGWCGTMRCTESLKILKEIASRNRESVQIYMRGFPTEIGLEAFEAAIADEPNMIYDGGYKSPDDLAEIYSEVDLNWGIELWDQSYDSKNSNWLLPNRLYEGGCLQVPMIAMAGTETAKRISELKAGWIVQEPLADSVNQFLETLTVEDYQAKRDQLNNLPMSTFWEIDDLKRICDQLLSLYVTDCEALAEA